MTTNDHVFILQEDEAAILYAALVEAQQKKVLEFDETHNPNVLEEIKQLRKLIDRVYGLKVMDTASLLMNYLPFRLTRDFSCVPIGQP